VTRQDSFIRLGRFILCVMLCIAPCAWGQTAQTRALTGTVQTDDGQPIANAAVAIEGSEVSVQTTALGHFRLENVPARPVVLVIRAAGFLELRVPDIAANSTAALEISLKPTPNLLEHVQVTATKIPLSTGDVAAQTDTIDRTAIEDRGDQTLTQAIANVPGAVVSTQLGIFESVMLRGMPRGDPEFTNTLLLIDGVPQTTSRNGSRVAGLTINDASSVEVVRGPNSALFGRTAIGGSVNVLTVDPTAVPTASAEFTGGGFGFFKGLSRVSGPLGQRGGYYFSVGKERNTGYYKNKTGDSFSDGNTSGFGKLTFAPDAKSFLSFSFNRVVSDNSTPTNEPIIDGQLLHVIDPRFDRLTNFNVPGPNYSHGESRLTANYTRQFSPVARVVEVFGYRDVEQRFINDGDFIGSPFDLDAHTIEQYPFNQDLKEKIFYQELRAELTPSLGRLKNSLVVGGSYERTSGTLATDFLFTDPDNEGIPINYLNPVIPPMSAWSHDVQPTRTYHLGNTGIFIQDTFQPTTRWVFTAGGRYDRLALDNIAQGGSNVADTFSAFSPKASATFKLLGAAESRPLLSLYSAYSHAFLPPRAPSSLTPANVSLNLRPEEINNVEGGLKGNLLKGRLSLEATYFHMLEDGVVLTRRQGPFFFPTNAGQLRYKGVEAGASMILSPKVSAYVNTAFYRNRFGDFVIQSADGDEALTGNRLPIAPDRVVNWGVVVNPVRSIETNFNVKHMGNVTADQENTFTIAPYTLTDAAVTWRRGFLRFTVSAHNLFNRQYYWNADDETADPGRPRQVLFTTSLTWKR
jgi:iron complex outermembrane receptor protein